MPRMNPVGFDSLVSSITRNKINVTGDAKEREKEGPKRK